MLSDVLAMLKTSTVPDSIGENKNDSNNNNMSVSC